MNALRKRCWCGKKKDRPSVSSLIRCLFLCAKYWCCANSKSFPIVKFRRSRPCRLAPSCRVSHARDGRSGMPGGARQIVIQDVIVTKDIARFRQAHREPEVASLRPREGLVRNCPGRPYQPETRRQPDHPEGAARGEQVVDLMEVLRRSVGNKAAPAKGGK